ncbi:MAG: DUF4288 domain-containing protein [Chloroflexota bacterium]
MNWYAVTTILKIEVENAAPPYTCDEQIRLIHAESEILAFQKAVQIALAEETTYRNADGEIVRWSFVGIESLKYIEEGIINGVEIRSRLFGHANPKSLVTKDLYSLREQEGKKSIRNEDIPPKD